MNKTTQTVSIMYSIQKKSQSKHNPSRKEPAYVRKPYTTKSLPSCNVVLVLNRYTLGHMVDLVHANQARGKFEHIVSE